MTEEMAEDMWVAKDSSELTAYYQNWLRVNEKMRAAHFLWGELFEEEEWQQYLSTEVYCMPRSQFQRLLSVTAQLAAILQKTYQLIDEDIEAFMQLGLPPATYNLKSIKSQYFTAFARLDFIVKDNEIFLLEINSDTPTGYVEGTVANQILCHEAGYTSPNRMVEAIRKTWQRLLVEYAIPQQETLYFTAYNWHDEDRETVQLLRRYCPHQHTEFIDIGDVVVSQKGLFTPQGQSIRFLHRLYPLEYLQDDIDERGQPIGHWFLQHIAEGRVKIINPPSAFIMQSKAVQAILYDWHYRLIPEFSAEEHATLANHLLPTYFTPDTFVKYEQTYVEKPFWGREGGGIAIIKPTAQVIAADHTTYYVKQPKIYQRYVEMPDFTLDTWDGAYTGKLLTSVFLIGGEPAGVFLRVGEKITGNLSMFLGVTVTDA